MQNDTSKYVRNIIPLQNILSNVSGTNATTSLSNSIVAIQQMIQTDTKTLKANTIESYSGTSIGILSGLNLCNVGITSNGNPFGLSNFTSINTSTLTAYSGTFSGICYAQQFVTLSDMNAKTGIREWRSPVLTDLQKVRPYIFKYDGVASEDIGLMAQEVGLIWPQLVKDGVKGSYVNYDGVVAMLVKAVQELAGRVSSLESSNLR